MIMFDLNYFFTLKDWMNYITSEVHLHGSKVAMVILDPHLYVACVALVILQYSKPRGGYKIFKRRRWGRV